MAGTLPKPQLRGYLRRFGIGMLTRATILASCFALAWKYLYAEPKKVKYAEYYKNYNVEAEMKRLCETGYMQSCEPSGEH